MDAWAPPPFRIKFDEARDPYTARNALGIMGSGGGFITSVTAPLSVTGGNLTIDLSGYQPLDADLTALAALTGTNTIYYRSAANTWTAVTIGTGLSFTGGTLANTIPAGGNVSNSGTPTVGQYAKWVTATTVQGVAPATVLSDIGAQPAGSYQPLDGDLTAISALAGTNVIYYRSAADTWSPVTISTGLSFSGGALTCTVSTAGSQPLDATLTALAAYNTNGLLTQTAADTFTGRTLAAPAAGFTITNPAGAAGNPTFVLANDLASLEAAAGTNTIYYRSGIDTWSPVVVSTGLAFSGGNLTATAGGG